MSRMIGIAGENLPLRYTVNSLCALEESMGCGLEALLKTGFSAVRGLLWCGLMEVRPHLSLKEAGDLLEKWLQSGESLGRIALQLSQALEEAGFFHPGKEGAAPPSPCGSNI